MTGEGTTDSRVSHMQAIVRDFCEGAGDGVPHNARVQGSIFGVAAKVIDEKTHQMQTFVRQSVVAHRDTASVVVCSVETPRSSNYRLVDRQKVEVFHLFPHQSDSDLRCLSDDTQVGHVRTFSTLDKAHEFVKLLQSPRGVFRDGVALIALGHGADVAVLFPRGLLQGVSVGIHLIDTVIQIPRLGRYFQQWGEFILQHIPPRYPPSHTSKSAVARVAKMSWLEQQTRVSPSRAVFWGEVVM